MINKVNYFRSEIMSVHKDLIKHAANQNKTYQLFLSLDQQRESYIEEAVELCKQGNPSRPKKLMRSQIK